MTASMHTEDLTCHDGHRYFLITGAGIVSGVQVQPGMGIACPIGQEADEAMATGLCREVADEAELKAESHRFFLEHPEAMADIPFHRSDLDLSAIDDEILQLRATLQRKLAEMNGPTPEQLQQRAHEFLERTLGLEEQIKPLMQLAARERQAAEDAGFSSAFAEAHAAAILSNLLSKAFSLGIVG
jgi:hypothetical protein